MYRRIAVTALVVLGCSRPEAPKWVISPKGIGPIKAGMTREAVASAVGAPLTGDSAWTNCGYVRSSGLPGGVSLMVEHGSIARVDIDSGTVATTEGARIGDPEDRIKSLYGSRLTVTPQKYDTVGHYLTVRSSDDTLHRIVFETDGQRVVRYRAGRTPQVEYVERCG